MLTREPRRSLAHGIQKFIADLIDHFTTAAYASPSVAQGLQVMLAEYNAYRAEIQARSDFQHRIVQLHVTALTVIVGAAVTTTAGFAILFLIPLESAVLGLQYLDHAFSIGEIGDNIDSIETRIDTLLQGFSAQITDGVTISRTARKQGSRLNAQERASYFRLVLWMTFVFPIVLTIIVILSVIMISAFYNHSVIVVPVPYGLSNMATVGSVLAEIIDIGVSLVFIRNLRLYMNLYQRFNPEWDESLINQFRDYYRREYDILVSYFSKGSDSIDRIVDDGRRNIWLIYQLTSSPDRRKILNLTDYLRVYRIIKFRLFDTKWRRFSGLPRPIIYDSEKNTVMIDSAFGKYLSASPPEGAGDASSTKRVRR